MITEESKLVVADNTGAKIAKCFRILGQRKRTAGVGDIIRVSIQEASPTGAVKKGQVCFALIVRTAHPLARPDGSFVRFDRSERLRHRGCQAQPDGHAHFRACGARTA